LKLLQPAGRSDPPPVCLAARRLVTTQHSPLTTHHSSYTAPTHPHFVAVGEGCRLRIVDCVGNQRPLECVSHVYVKVNTQNFGYQILRR